MPLTLNITERVWTRLLKRENLKVKKETREKEGLPGRRETREKLAPPVRPVHQEPKAIRETRESREKEVHREIQEPKAIKATRLRLRRPFLLLRQ